MACKSVEFYGGLNNKDAYRLYKRSLKQSSGFLYKYNADSSYVICIDDNNSMKDGLPLSFMVIDLKSNENVFLSFKVYHKVYWAEQGIVEFIRYAGIERRELSPNKPIHANSCTYQLNIHSGKLQPIDNPDEQK